MIQAFSFYTVEPSYEVSYKTFQMFGLRTHCIQNKTFEKSRTKVQMGWKLKLKIEWFINRSVDLTPSDPILQ